MTATLSDIHDLIPNTFHDELFGLVYTGAEGRVVVSEDGPELLVGIYAPDGSEPLDSSLVIPADATDDEVQAAIVEALESVTDHSLKVGDRVRVALMVEAHPDLAGIVWEVTDDHGLIAGGGNMLALKTTAPGRKGYRNAWRRHLVRAEEA